MVEAEQRNQPYLFKQRITPNVKRTIEKAMEDQGWQPVVSGWEGKCGKLQLKGWSHKRNIVILRRPKACRKSDVGGKRGQLQLPFREISTQQDAMFEYAVLVTSLEEEALTVAACYCDRADCENNFDELKNQWGWGGFTTKDMKRCRLMAGLVALCYNWWNLFARLADPDHHREAITSRPLLLNGVGRVTNHAGQTTVTITSSHGDHQAAETAFRRIASFFATLRETAEQLTPIERWHRILSEALKSFLNGKILHPPQRLLPSAAATYG